MHPRQHGSAQTGHSPNIQPRVSEVPHHIVRQRANPIRSSGSGEVQQRHRHRPCYNARHEGTQRRRHACSTRFSIETSRNALCHGPADLGMTVSRSTTGHPPQHQAQSACHVLLWRSVPGMCAPSVGELLPEPLHSVSACRIAPCFSVRVECTDHGGVHG